MFVLVVDSSSPAVTAAVVEVGPDTLTLRAQGRGVDARAHGELLAPQVRAVLAETGLRAAELTAIVAGLGPGPFTGLRVGLVTAATMGQALDVPTYGVCSLDALGRDAARSAPGGPVLVAGDARRREIYWALYDADGGRRTGPKVGTPAEVAEQIAPLGVAVAVGEGAHCYREVLGLPVADEPRYPPAYALAELAADRIRAGAPGERLTPLYLRRPDAVAATGRKSVLR